MEQQGFNYTKLAIRLGVLTGVVLLGRFIYKKIKEKEALRGFGNLSNITNNNAGNQLGVNQAGQEYGILAKELYELMDGVDWFNMNEQKIIDRIASMDCFTRKQVEKSFNENYGGGENFDSWLADDLSGSKLIQARNLMACTIDTQQNFVDELDEDGYTIGASTSQPIRVSVTNTGSTPMPETIGGLGK